MDQRKALTLLREILEITKQCDVHAISINTDDSGDFSLKLDCTLDKNTQDSITTILDRKKLTLNQENGFLIISGK